MVGETADIIIVGAGIIGLNTALQIARRSDARILVLEKGAGLGEGSTGASSAVCRFRYSRPEMVQLAKDGINAYQHWSDYLELTQPRACYHRHGVLWLATSLDDWSAREAARLQSFGLRAEVLDDAELTERYPAINPCLIAPDLDTAVEHECVGGGRHLLEIDGGYFEPVDALQDLVEATRQRGVDVHFGCSVASIRTESGKVRGVGLADGSEIPSGTVVNASGPWCNALLQSAGVTVNWSLEPTRIQVVHLDRPPELVGDIPVCVDQTGGIYFRLQNRGQQLIVSSVLEQDEKEVVDDPDDFARYVDDDFERAKLYALQHRLPALTIRGVTGYTGLYTMNRQDVHPVVGLTEVEGLYVANGCSGHGFKLAPAIGSLLAQMICGGDSSFDTGVDKTFLSPGRQPIELESKSVLA